MYANKPTPQPLKPGCTGPAFTAGLKAAFNDILPIPPQYNPNPVNGVLDFATSKPGQALAIGVIYQGAKFLPSVAADAAADFVPIAGQLWLAYQVGHALYVGGSAYKQSVDQCYGGN